MKLSKLITEQTFSNYSEFAGAVVAAKVKEDYPAFQKLIKQAKQAKQYEFIGRLYVDYDASDSNIITKQMFKLIAPF